METMTPKERIDAVIKHQAVDRTPFTVVDGGHMFPLEQPDQVASLVKQLIQQQSA